MKGQSRPGHANYYQQLGVESGATTEEIREAYRSLARLLHPDQHTDPHLKAMAEQQMRKLNPIYTTLSDPERRRQYDDDLDEQYATPVVIGDPVRGPRGPVPGRLVWTVAAIAGVGLLYWLATGSQGGGEIDQHFVPRPVIQATAKPAPETAREIDVLRSQIKTLTAERDFAMRELVRYKVDTDSKPRALAPPVPSPSRPSIPTMPQTMTELPPPLPQASAVPALPGNLGLARPTFAKPATAKATLAGFWFYTKPKDGQKNKNQSLYIPEFMEATITEKNGQLTGKYSSRFRIADQAISPEVNFVFSGTPNGSTLNCPWTGQGGARGEVTLKLASDNSLRIDWAASELGSQQALASGTAVLTRRLD